MVNKIFIGIDFGSKIDKSVATTIKKEKDGTIKVLDQSEIKQEDRKPAYTQIFSAGLKLSSKCGGKSVYPYITQRFILYQQILQVKMVMALGITSNETLHKLRSLRSKLGHITRRLKKHYGTIQS